MKSLSSFSSSWDQGQFPLGGTIWQCVDTFLWSQLGARCCWCPVGRVQGCGSAHHHAQDCALQQSVVPDVRIPKREERRPPRQCNWQKGEVYYWLEPGHSAASNAVVQVREPWAQAVTQIYRVSTHRWFKWIGYKFAKQFHWSKLSRGRDFPGGFCPIPNFLICKQQSVLSES